MAQTVKNLPTMQKNPVRALGREEPLEKGILESVPVFLPGKFYGQRSLVGYSPWGCKESDTNEQLTHAGWKTDSFLFTDFYL